MSFLNKALILFIVILLLNYIHVFRKYYVKPKKEAKDVEFEEVLYNSFYKDFLYFVFSILVLFTVLGFAISGAKFDDYFPLLVIVQLFKRRDSVLVITENRIYALKKTFTPNEIDYVKGRKKFIFRFVTIVSSETNLEIPYISYKAQNKVKRFCEINCLDYIEENKGG